ADLAEALAGEARRQLDGLAEPRPDLERLVPAPRRPGAVARAARGVAGEAQELGARVLGGRRVAAEADAALQVPPRRAVVAELERDRAERLERLDRRLEPHRALELAARRVELAHRREAAAVRRQRLGPGRRP